MNAKRNTPALGTKATEIEMLAELFSIDGYLADSMQPEDLQQMTNNINNDFPIFMNTSIDQEARIGRLQDLNTELEERNINLVREMEAKNNQITCIAADLDSARSIKEGIVLQAIKADSLYLVEDFTTENEILRIKLKNNLALTDRERHSLLNLI